MFCPPNLTELLRLYAFSSEALTEMSLNADPEQCRINYGSGGSPEPGTLNLGGLIISQT